MSILDVNAERKEFGQWIAAARAQFESDATQSSTEPDMLGAWLAARTPNLDAVPDTSQDWAKLDGASAFHLIERHADNWQEAGRMMEAWFAARQATSKGLELAKVVEVAADALDELRTLGDMLNSRAVFNTADKALVVLAGKKVKR